MPQHARIRRHLFPPKEGSTDLLCAQDKRPGTDGDTLHGTPLVYPLSSQYPLWSAAHRSERGTSMDGSTPDCKPLVGHQQHSGPALLFLWPGYTCGVQVRQLQAKAQAEAEARQQLQAFAQKCRAAMRAEWRDKPLPGEWQRDPYAAPRLRALLAYALERAPEDQLVLAAEVSAEARPLTPPAHRAAQPGSSPGDLCSDYHVLCCLLCPCRPCTPWAHPARPYQPWRS